MNLNVSHPPSSLCNLSDEEIFSNIENAKKKLGNDLIILGHHYQRDEVLQFADKKGDSYKLAVDSAESKAKYIVFCGVHFMAETTDVLTDATVKVMLPNIEAGCFLADTAEPEHVQNAWNEITKVCNEKVTPITYVNSKASLKSFCGRNGGATCTSSNAEKIIRWAFESSEKVFFFPDQHLGRNIANLKLNIPLDKIILYDYEQNLGGHTEKAIEKAKVILWKGYCDVHDAFKTSHINEIRRKVDNIRVIVHPECTYEVTSLADDFGSTSQIIEAIESAPPKSKWAIGTEIHLVERLQKNHIDKEIYPLSKTNTECKTMSNITKVHLLWILENIIDGNFYNIIETESEHREGSLTAIKRMIDITSQ